LQNLDIPGKTSEDVLREELGSASRSLEAQLQHGVELKNELAK
jgi:hypothetical protein